MGLGTLRAGIGGHEERRKHLAAAQTLYREMEMPFWLEKAEFEIKALS
jgi:hypothetical protein